MNVRFPSILRARAGAAAAGVLLALALAGCGGSNASSDNGGAGGSANASGPAGAAAAAGSRHRMAQVLASLGLSDDQKTQIRQIMSDARKASAGADPATRRANYKAAFAKIDGVLTPDQRTELHAKLDEFRKEREQGASPQP